MEVNGQLQVPIALPQKNITRCTLQKKVGDAEGRYEHGGGEENPYPCQKLNPVVKPVE
jgi:hypothetical protein